MSLKKVVSVDRIEVIQHGCVQVRTKTTIVENGEEISSVFRRHVVAPGDDYTTEDIRVKDICAAVHTKQVVDAYKAAQAN